MVVSCPTCPTGSSGLEFYSPWMHCRLFTAFASEAAKAQQDDDAAWQAGFKLSYDLGCSLLRGRRQLPALALERATGSSHLMRLALHHRDLVAAPQPVAGQGAHLSACVPCTAIPSVMSSAPHCIHAFVIR